ncbi:histidinol-phosphate transaminase [Sinirhodobacter huangdaonensis]|uniref:Histidinol-phosphate aminotransferase n=1 Tax=Paenirhodobacter huangdaonensis TaxID=2501515 RepID=A0A443M0J0_9RHOB|nr:histidinol-phosphate transaminase [Sinirhodobacter huangdaonensis]RWR54968.1 histidinol-phosphate transaminase [Sinirhodobacter huangdaonensis]
MNDLIRPKPGILDIALYEGGAAHVAGLSDAVKLSSNENPFGPSDKAKEAFSRAVHKLNRYPSTDHAGLRQAIGEVHGLDPAQIICGVGSDELIRMIVNAYAGPKDEVLFTEHGFLMYRIAALGAGATPVAVAERERTTDVDALLKACTKKTKLVFLANPNNPTGTMIGLAELERLAMGLPKQAILVIDGAYAEYVEGYDGGADLATRLPNVFMTRTFSKIYGLGGLRIGWGYGPRHIIDVLNRIRDPFNLSTAQLETAEAAIRDQDWITRCRDDNTRLRGWLAEALAERGVPSDTSTANFILARFASEEEAVACDEFLKKDGLIVRRVAGYGLPNCLRITVGDEPSCRRVAHMIGQFKAGAAA